MSSDARYAGLVAQHADGRGRVLHQLGRRADGPAHKFAAAVGANVAELGRGAVEAESALEGADVGLLRGGREIPVAAFAVGSEFEHGRGVRG